MISPHIRDIVYHTAIKFGGVEEWEFLWNKYQKTIDATEKSRMLYALSGSKEPWLLNRSLFDSFPTLFRISPHYSLGREEHSLKTYVMWFFPGGGGRVLVMPLWGKHLVLKSKITTVRIIAVPFRILSRKNIQNMSCVV